MSIGRGAYAATLDAVIARTGARGAMLLLFRVTEDGLLRVERETHLFTPLTPRVLGVILRDIANELAAPGDGTDPDAPAESGMAPLRAPAEPTTPRLSKRRR